MLLRQRAKRAFTVGAHPPTPLRDAPGYMDCWVFGNAYVNGFDMAMCDGSVHGVSYSVDFGRRAGLPTRLY